MSSVATSTITLLFTEGRALTPDEAAADAKAALRRRDDG
jgi:hypothetical protein